MENEWLDLACINHEKYIVHGQIAQSDYTTIQIEQVLTPEQKNQVDDLFCKHELEMRALLKSFVA